MKKIICSLLLVALLCPCVFARSEAQTLKWLSVDQSAVLPNEAVAEALYSPTIVRNDIEADIQRLLPILLGEGYEKKPRDEYSYADEYVSVDSDKPYRYFNVYDEDGHVWYYDAMVTGEREGEYQPPAINMTREESIEYCRELLSGIVPADWLVFPSNLRPVQTSWLYMDRPMTEKELDDYYRNAQEHYIVFDHMSESGIAILDDSLLAVVGANGLSELDISRHGFETPEAEPIRLMPFDEALARCDSTRSGEAVVIYAVPVYSNRVSGTDAFNLCWLIATNKGNYVVDCILGGHICDMYEY